MQHGLSDTAAGFIINYPDKAPGFRLAKEGYDVWLGNQRGTLYSRTHQTLDIEDEAYWDFSFAELGDFDAPAQVDYVRNYTQ